MPSTHCGAVITDIKLVKRKKQPVCVIEIVMDGYSGPCFSKFIAVGWFGVILAEKLNINDTVTIMCTHAVYTCDYTPKKAWNEEVGYVERVIPHQVVYKRR